MSDHSPSDAGSPALSVLIVCYEMADQIANTLYSLSPLYQKDISSAAYEVILVDNGSAAPLHESVWSPAPNVRYIYIPPGDASRSPAAAVNKAAANAHADLLCIMIDGARMLTPGVLHWGRRLMELSDRAAAEVRGWHFGPKFQPESVTEGYTPERERELLASIDWKRNGYRLFEISSESAQTKSKLATPPNESNCVFLTKATFDRIGGFDERYQQPGGGFVNLDFYARLVAEVERMWTILGEGTFHQFHGGAATGLPIEELKRAITEWRGESHAIRGELSRIDARKFIVAGHVPQELRAWMAKG